jgi:hydrogenase maturation factor
VYRNLGAPTKAILTGPSHGKDNAFITVDGRTVMVVTADPVSAIPQVGMQMSAWLSVHLIASDYTTSGAAPSFASFTFNFPTELSSGDRNEYLKSLGAACKELGIAIVAGHTGTYPGASFTVVGGGMMFGFTKKGGYIDSSMSLPDDVILMTKGAAIESAASLAWSFPKFAEERVGRTLARRARLLLNQCSTVKDALTVRSVGLGKDGVTSMHDATEGGVLGALREMSESSEKAFVVERELLHVPAEAEAVCSAFKLDPLTSLSEGTLLLTCKPSRADEVLRKLRRNGVPAFAIGRVREGGGLWMSRRGGIGKRVTPTPDQYWDAYERSIKAGIQ